MMVLGEVDRSASSESGWSATIRWTGTRCAITTSSVRSPGSSRDTSAISAVGETRREFTIDGRIFHGRASRPGKARFHEVELPSIDLDEDELLVMTVGARPVQHRRLRGGGSLPWSGTT